MDLSERIIKYIENHHPISYTSIVNVAAGKGFSESEVLQALEKVARSKTITTKTRGTEVWYDLIVIKEYVEPPHLAWLRDNYPYSDYKEMPFPEIDMSYIFMTRDEAKEYRAQAKGMPVHMMKTYGK